MLGGVGSDWGTDPDCLPGGQAAVWVCGGSAWRSGFGGGLLTDGLPTGEGVRESAWFGVCACHGCGGSLGRQSPQKKKNATGNIIIEHESNKKFDLSMMYDCAHVAVEFNINPHHILLLTDIASFKRV